MHRLILPFLIASSLLGLVAGFGDRAAVAETERHKLAGDEVRGAAKGDVLHGLGWRPRREENRDQSGLRDRRAHGDPGAMASIHGQQPESFLPRWEGKENVQDISDEDLKQYPVEEVSWEDVARSSSRNSTKGEGRAGCIGYRVRRNGNMPVEEGLHLKTRVRTTSTLISRRTTCRRRGELQRRPPYGGRQGDRTCTAGQSGFLQAKQAGALRHARKRLAVVCRLAHRGREPRNSGRQLERQRPELSGGISQLDGAVWQFPQPGLPACPSSVW